MTKTPKFLNFRVREIIKRLGVFCVKKNYEKKYGVGNNYSKNIEKTENNSRRNLFIKADHERIIRGDRKLGLNCWYCVFNK